MKCDLCGKGVMIGRQHTHHPGVAGGRWKKRAPKTVKYFRPNLHPFTVVLKNVHKRMRLCTKCLRIVKSQMKEEQQKVSPVQPHAPAATA